MAILVTGGAGYIGSHTVKKLIENNEKVIVVDNLQTGHIQAFDKEAQFYQGDLRDDNVLEKIFSDNAIDSVVHFAADSIVSESIQNPVKYYENNIISAINLVKFMNTYNVKNIVFSSTAAVYGEADRCLIDEDAILKPANPYGETKLTVEKFLRWSKEAFGLNYLILRYFNVAGASIDGSIGEDHNPETHLIPSVLEVALKKRDKVTIYGDNYSTEDGTCIRDYIHVMDIAHAHILALEKLKEQEICDVFNLGSEKGYSVKEVIEVARKITKQEIAVEVSKKREGDPPKLVASAKKAKKQLGWKPEFSTLEEMIETSWQWIKKHPNGYERCSG